MSFCGFSRGENGGSKFYLAGAAGEDNDMQLLALMRRDITALPISPPIQLDAIREGLDKKATVSRAKNSTFERRAHVRHGEGWLH